MRSHPHTPPPPLSLPLPLRPASEDDIDIPLSDLDPDTSRLLPRKRRQHHVRVQGRLAMVQSVSVVNLKASSASGDALVSPQGGGGTRFDTGVGSTTQRRRRAHSSDDGGSSEMGDDVEERDTQLRGYGIGGAGNIRRPIDVIGSSTRGSSSFTSLFSSSSSHSIPPNPRDFYPDTPRRWNFAELLGRIRDRKGKGNVTTA